MLKGASAPFFYSQSLVIVSYINLFNAHASELFNIPVKYIKINASTDPIYPAFFAVLPEMPGSFKFIIKPVVVKIASYP
jgi:hypothetical protein